jgi:prolyl-tRNA synthetase
MRQSELFPKTMREIPRGAKSTNHQLLVRAGFIDQLMTGSWTLLPLGLRVINNINRIIREEMNEIGGQEMLMPLMTPKKVWDITDRWESAKEVMYQFEDDSGKEYGLAFTHEEVVMDLLKKKIVTYKDLPTYVYHFSTKFRNEPRPKSGILRGREFLMKDLYSFHTSQENLMYYYDKVKDAYTKIFKRLGFDFRVTEALGGTFTDSYTHEFQVLAEGGEDTIYYCDSCDWGQNKEIFEGKEGQACPGCKEGNVLEAKAIEVGNIFPLGTWFSEKMSFYFTDENNERKPVWFGSYGIGPTRVMGAWVEVSSDESGIIWNKEIAPFHVHLIELPGAKNCRKIYENLTSNGIEVLWDEREALAGEKFVDADLIGIPVRLVVSSKTGNKLEWSNRADGKMELLSYEGVLERLKEIE